MSTFQTGKVNTLKSAIALSSPPRHQDFLSFILREDRVEGWILYFDLKKLGFPEELISLRMEMESKRREGGEHERREKSELWTREVLKKIIIQSKTT